MQFSRDALSSQLTSADAGAANPGRFLVQRLTYQATFQEQAAVQPRRGFKACAEFRHHAQKE